MAFKLSFSTHKAVYPKKRKLSGEFLWFERSKGSFVVLQAFLALSLSVAQKIIGWTLLLRWGLGL